MISFWLNVGDTATDNWSPGLEFAGRLENGRRIMGFVPFRGLATTVAVDPHLMWDVPNDWTLEEASTVPVAYATSYYALVVRGRLQRGESVLIHSGSGGVGQAAIAIALHYGCEVYTSVAQTDSTVSPSLRMQHIVAHSISAAPEEGITVFRHYPAKLRIIVLAVTKYVQDPLFVPKSTKSGSAVREYYGRLVLSGKIIGTPKIRFQILLPHYKKHTELTFDTSAHTSSVARGNEKPDMCVGLECNALPSSFENIRQS
ncbi:fatty acid synthase [Trichonephila clavipes]|nr:fatty acid synthase [Trichonephila clavipes]